SLDAGAGDHVLEAEPGDPAANAAATTAQLLGDHALPDTLAQEGDQAGILFQRPEADHYAASSFTRSSPWGRTSSAQRALMTRHLLSLETTPARARASFSALNKLSRSLARRSGG